MCAGKESDVDLLFSLHQIWLFANLRSFHHSILLHGCPLQVEEFIFSPQLPIFVDNSATRLESSPRAHIMPYFSKSSLQPSPSNKRLLWAVTAVRMSLYVWGDSSYICTWYLLDNSLLSHYIRSHVAWVSNFIMIYMCKISSVDWFFRLGV